MADADPLTIYVLTFNCARRRVEPTTLAHHFFTALPPDQPLPDILAVSLQEIAPIAYAFLGGTLVDSYFDAVARTVALAAAQRAGNWAPGSVDGADEDGDVGGYEHVVTQRVGMTALMLFVRAPVRARIRRMESAGTGVGLWRMGNKGAVAVRFAVEGRGGEEGDEDGDWEELDVEITIVAAHMAPMEWNVPRRKWDFEHIVSDLVFQRDPVPDHVESEPGATIEWNDLDSDDETAALIPPPSAPKPSDTDADRPGIYGSDGLVIFAGDLNYRTSDTRPRLSDHATFPQPGDSVGAQSHYLSLLARDQLARERANGSVLQHFTEAPIAFPPTYKYLRRPLRRRSAHGDDERWPWAWHRWPSWCDRVLYLPSPLIRCVLGYAALPVQPTSDHRPVALALAVDAGAAKAAGGRRRFAAPVPPNPHAREERAAVQGREFAVGFVAYLVLRPMGNAMLVGIAAGGLAFWYLMHRLVLA